MQGHDPPSDSAHGVHRVHRERVEPPHVGAAVQVAGEAAGGTVRAADGGGDGQADERGDGGHEAHDAVLPPPLHFDVQHRPQRRNLRGDGVEAMEEGQLAI